MIRIAAKDDAQLFYEGLGPESAQFVFHPSCALGSDGCENHMPLFGGVS